MIICRTNLNIKKTAMLKKEYIYLYLTRFCYSLANTLIDIYGTVLLYKNGLSVAQIFLIYAIRFGLMGIITPFSIVLSTRLGIGVTSFIANLTRITFSYVILFNITDNITFLILLLALPGGLSNPLAAVLSANHVQSNHRGKYNSLRIISKILGAAIANLIILYGINYNQQMLLFVVVMTFFMLDSLFTFMVSFKPQKLKANAFKETLTYITKTKDSFKLLYILRTAQIAERLFIPLYLYLALENFVLFSAVISVSLIFQIILMLFSGYFTDKNISKMNNIVTILRLITTSIFIITRNKVIISINKATFDSIEQIYDMVYISSIENIIKKNPKENSLLASSGEMCLCFTELLCFSLIALIALYSATGAFIFMFACSIISTIMMNKMIQKHLKQ